MFDDGHRDRLATRIAGVLGQARKEVQLRRLGHFHRADPDYGRRVAAKLGVKETELVDAQTPAVQLHERDRRSFPRLRCTTPSDVNRT
jgi:catalase